MRKMMFNDHFGLTDLVLMGEKTQTRRIIKPQPRYDENGGMVFKTFSRKDGKCIEWMCGKGSYGENPKAAYRNAIHRSPIKVGEIIAVAQSYRCIKLLGSPYTVDKSEPGYSNKMFVKPELMPHQIKIINVRLEPLQDISDEDCFAEGIIKAEDYWGLIKENENYSGVIVDCTKEEISNHYTFLFNVFKKEYLFTTPREAYACLIDKISGRGTWESNPFVWVYDFELVK